MPQRRPVGILEEVEDLPPRRPLLEGRRQVEESGLGNLPPHDGGQPVRKVVLPPAARRGVGGEAGTVEIDPVLARHENDEEPGALGAAEPAGLAQSPADHVQIGDLLRGKGMRRVLEVHPHVPAIARPELAVGVGQGAGGVLPLLGAAETAQGVKGVAGEGAQGEGVVAPRQLGPDRQRLAVTLDVLEIVALEEGPDAGFWVERQAVAPEHLQLLLRPVPGLPQVDHAAVEIGAQAGGHQLGRRHPPPLDEGVADHHDLRRVGVRPVAEAVLIVLVEHAVPDEPVVRPVEVEQRGIDQVARMAPRLRRGGPEEDPEVDDVQQDERLEQADEKQRRGAGDREPLRQLAAPPPRDPEGDPPTQQVEGEDP
jgi:hypothetical protein